MKSGEGRLLREKQEFIGHLPRDERRSTIRVLIGSEGSSVTTWRRLRLSPVSYVIIRAIPGVDIHAIGYLSHRYIEREIYIYILRYI